MFLQGKHKLNFTHHELSKTSFIFHAFMLLLHTLFILHYVVHLPLNHRLIECARTNSNSFVIYNDVHKNVCKRFTNKNVGKGFPLVRVL